MFFYVTLASIEIKETGMVSVIYASLSAFLIVWLSLNVIKKRHSNRVNIGDGGIEELKIAMAAQSNAIEYIPIALLLLFALEYNKTNILIVHISGLSLVLGRLIHAKGILSENLKRRVLGMQITIYTILGLALINFAYLPYAQLFKL
jgi:uncharacterized membrane protein YecN with MAPEG domain